MPTKQRYFFVLGSNPALSVAELAALFALDNSSLLAKDFLLWESAAEISAVETMSRLGGTIKIGLVRDEVTSLAELADKIFSLAQAKQAVSPAGKFNFGFSDYGEQRFNKIALGAELKKRLSAAGVSCRFVVSREATLSSVVVAQNKLLSRGMEIVLVKAGNKILIGETLAVQPFKDLSRRDYGRPARDDRSGMLPPKLAQMMINLAQLDDHDELLADPFCGSGTVLSEALLMGYKNLAGSDLSPKAIDDTYKNLSWIRELYKIYGVKVNLKVKNAIDLGQFLKASSVGAIVTEPFLGPQRGLIEFKTVIANLEELYSLAIKEFNQVLKPGRRAVMIWPLFYGQRPIAPKYDGFELIEALPKHLKDSPFLKKHSRSTIVYGRSGQKVYREIAILQKK